MKLLCVKKLFYYCILKTTYICYYNLVLYRYQFSLLTLSLVMFIRQV